MEKLLKTLPNSDKIIKEYQADVKLCRKTGEKEHDCLKLVDLKYTRKFPALKDLVYPWINYDWDYTTFVDNNYNKQVTGATDKPTLGGLFSNIDAMTTLANAYTFKANPNNSSRAAVSDLPQCNPNESNYQGCTIMNELRKSNQTTPFPDSFFNKNLSGENSSSYFIRAGSCPKPDLNKEQCQAKGYSWIENPLYANSPVKLLPPEMISGSCFKPKYAYIKNTPGIELDFGDIAKINTDLADLSAKATGAIGNVAAKAASISGNATDNPFAGKMAGMAIKQSTAATTGSINMASRSTTAGLKMAQGPINQLLSIYKGSNPSMMGDLMSLNPLALKRVMDGETTNDFSLMGCEGFTSCRNKVTNSKDKLWITILFLLLIFTSTFIIMAFIQVRKSS